MDIRICALILLVGVLGYADSQHLRLPRHEPSDSSETSITSGFLRPHRVLIKRAVDTPPPKQSETSRTPPPKQESPTPPSKQSETSRTPPPKQDSPTPPPKQESPTPPPKRESPTPPPKRESPTPPPKQSETSSTPAPTPKSETTTTPNPKAKKSVEPEKPQDEKSSENSSGQPVPGVGLRSAFTTTSGDEPTDSKKKPAATPNSISNSVSSSSTSGSFGPYGAPSFGPGYGQNYGPSFGPVYGAPAGPNAAPPGNQNPAPNASPNYNSNYGPNYVPNYGPGYGAGYGNPGYGSAYPNYPYPAYNTIPGSQYPGNSNNYAWTSNTPGGASASAGSYASAGAFAGADGQTSLGTRGGFADNVPNNSGYSNTAGTGAGANPFPSGPGFGGYGPNGFGPAFGPDSFADFQSQMDQQFRNLQAQIEAHHRSIVDANNIASRGGFGPDGPQSAISSISIGPDGGFQSGQINPAAPGIESRFADDLPAPSGNSYGVFSSSSSSSMTGPDGKQINHKSATTGLNDNGKITYRTVHD